MPAPDGPAAALDATLQAAQREQRMPSAAAAAFRRGELVWSRALGLADDERREAATVDHAYGPRARTAGAASRDASEASCCAPCATSAAT